MSPRWSYRSVACNLGQRVAAKSRQPAPPPIRIAASALAAAGGSQPLATWRLPRNQRF